MTGQGGGGGGGVVSFNHFSRPPSDFSLATGLIDNVHQAISCHKGLSNFSRVVCVFVFPVSGHRIH